MFKNQQKTNTNHNKPEVVGGELIGNCVEKDELMDAELKAVCGGKLIEVNLELFENLTSLTRLQLPVEER